MTTLVPIWRRNDAIIRLGTSHGGKYSYHLDNGYVYQTNIYGRRIGWICSYPAWERTMHAILDDVDKHA